MEEDRPGGLLLLRLETLTVLRSSRLSIFHFLLGMLSIAPLAPAPSGEFQFNVYPGVLAVGVCGGGFAFLRVAGRWRKLHQSSTLIRWCTCLFGWMALSFFCYPGYAALLHLRYDSLRAVMSAGALLCMFGYFFLGLYLCFRQRAFRSFLWGAFATAAIYLIGLMYFYYQNSLFARLFEARAIAGWYPAWPSRFPLVFLLMSGVALGFAAGAKRKTRLFMVSAAVIFVLASIISLTRAAWVGLIVGAIVLVVYRLPAWKWALALGLAAMLNLIGSSLQTTLRTRATLLDASGGVENSSAVRLAIWKASFAALRKSPVFGYGQLGTSVILDEVGTQSEVFSGMSAHSDYVDAAIRAGLPALAGYVGIICALLRLGYFASRSGRPDGVFIGYVVAGLMAGYGYGFFHEFLREPESGGLGLFLVGALAASRANAWKKKPVRQLAKRVCAA